jgi:hypothetical protein
MRCMSYRTYVKCINHRKAESSKVKCAMMERSHNAGGSRTRNHRRKKCVCVCVCACVCVLSTGDEKKREDLTTTYLPMSSS